MQQQAFRQNLVSLHLTFTRKRRFAWIFFGSVVILGLLLGLTEGILGLLFEAQTSLARLISIARVVVYPYWISRFVPALLWELIGTESVESDATGLTLTRRIGPWKRQWHFTWAELRTLELAMPLPKGKQADLPWTLERGVFQLRYRGEMARFGLRLEHNTVLSFLEEVRSLARQTDR